MPKQHGALVLSASETQPGPMRDVGRLAEAASQRQLRQFVFR